MGRLLVIDDQGEFREVISDLLRDAGYNVLSVGTPEEGRLELAAGGFDLVLCDLVMPVSNPDISLEDFDYESESAMVGVHAISQFKREFPDVPVIAVSGKLTGNSLKGIRQFGAFSTLSKPFSQDALIRAVREAIGEVPRRED